MLADELLQGFDALFELKKLMRRAAIVNASCSEPPQGIGKVAAGSVLLIVLSNIAKNNERLMTTRVCVDHIQPQQGAE